MTTQDAAEAPQSMFALVGGHPTFTKLVDAFYAGVADDPYLIAMYPDGRELVGAKHRLQGFLEQYFGGPTTYSQERGHPRLRMRHMPFTVTPRGREHWLAHMRAALDTLELAPMYDAAMWDYFNRAATAMINSFEEPGARDRAPGSNDRS
jgi:hemoglobin